MDKKNQYWKVPLDEEVAKQLDIELLEEINEYYGDEDDEETEDNEQLNSRPFAVKFIGAVTVCIFLLVVLAGGFRFFGLPPLDFLAQSWELARNPEIRELRESVVVVNSLGRQGTGFNIEPTGLIVTNYHVIRGARVVYVNFINGDLYYVRETLNFPEIDIALLKIEGENIPAVYLETENSPQTGDGVLIIGNPLGFTRIINEGQIAGTTRLSGWDREVLMIEGAIHQGSSGSPVFNADGKVVAVVFATLRPNLDNDERVGLAVPIEHFLERLDLLFK